SVVARDTHQMFEKEPYAVRRTLAIPYIAVIGTRGARINYPSITERSNINIRDGFHKSKCMSFLEIAAFSSVIRFTNRCDRAPVSDQMPDVSAILRRNPGNRRAIEKNKGKVIRPSEVMLSHMPARRLATVSLLNNSGTDRKAGLA